MHATVTSREVETARTAAHLPADKLLSRLLAPR